jgi:hypothetical protein
MSLCGGRCGNLRRGFLLAYFVVLKHTFLSPGLLSEHTLFLRRCMGGNAILIESAAVINNNLM